ncbi:MAG: hypothetical protein RSD36_15590, partial [Terrisporobacter sp.]
MKKWFKPQVQELGLEMTFGKGDHHVCHNIENPCDGTNSASGHNNGAQATHPWTGNICPINHGNDNGESDCCCYDQLNPVPPTPGES